MIQLGAESEEGVALDVRHSVLGVGSSSGSATHCETMTNLLLFETRAVVLFATSFEKTSLTYIWPINIALYDL